MSTQFIVEYAGALVHFYRNSHCYELVRADSATMFASEADAWYAAYQANLPPHWCRVVNLYTDVVAPK